MDLKEQQTWFTAWVRQASTEEKTKNERLLLYQQLVFRGIESVIAQCLPVCKKTLKKDWDTLIKQFVKNSESKSPLFYELPEVFLQYLENHPTLYEDRPYLHQLAHYEWIELSLSLMDEKVHERDSTMPSDWLSKKPIFSRRLAALSYEYPVHLIGPDHETVESGEFFYLAQHDDEQFYVQTINPLTAALFNFCQEKSESTAILIETFAKQANLDAEALIPHVKSLWEQWQKDGIILQFTD